MDTTPTIIRQDDAYVFYEGPELCREYSPQRGDLVRQLAGQPRRHRRR